MALGNNAIRACLVLIVACVAHASPPQPSSTPSAGGGSGKFDITKLGARGDGKTDSTKAFMEAWTSACAAAGKQEVVVPKGDFLVGPLTLEGPCKGKVRIHLDGNLLGTNDLSQYKKNWIEIIRVDGLAISGHGTLDGQGAGVWHNNQCHKSYNCRTLPNTLVLDFVTNSTIRYITLLNSKFFHMNMFGCEHVLVESVAIRAPGDSPNTDGIHIGDSSDITIKKASIGTGDDCISIGPGSVRITVDGVHCGPGHGISVGSLGRYKDEKDVRDITVKDCVLKGTTNGLRIKSYEDSPSAITASKFTYSGITMDNVAFPIIIDQKYCPNNICTKSGSSKVTISDVVFKNIKGTSSTPAAVSLVCTSVLPCKGVRLENVDLKYTGTDNKTMAVCSNAHGTATGVPQELACL